MLTDIEIAQSAALLPIIDVAQKLGLQADDLTVFGRHMAKLTLGCTNALNNPNSSNNSLSPSRNGKLILVTAISPTPAGEGKTTTTIGLADALNLVLAEQHALSNKLSNNTSLLRAIACLREPSLGPVFGKKGGATGGGYAQVLPMEDINLHFTGDFHAISSANNLLAALIDNHLYHGNLCNIDVNTITWRRCVDMNDRALRHVTLNTLADKTHPAFTRESAFDITVASEVMAIFCLAESLQDLQTRLGNIQIGLNYAGKPVLASDLQAEGAMTTLLKNAFQPNLVQTIAHTPVIVHGGPFANIAHGCNSIIATKTALNVADFVVTEAGFGADLGAEKFINIKCRQMGIAPDIVVLVATVRALKYHGGVEVDALNDENLNALLDGMRNIKKHIENLTVHFGLNVVVALNHFNSDTNAEISLLQDEIAKLGVQVVLCKHWAQGAIGAKRLAETVLAKLSQQATPILNAFSQTHNQFQAPNDINVSQNAIKAPFQYLYALDEPIGQKIKTIAQKLYGAKDISWSEAAKATLLQLNAYAHLPVCIAKTQYSFSSQANLRGAPKDHILQIRELRLSRGAGFIVVVCGDLMTMPGLPKAPASEHISVNSVGKITGLS
jgi:formate--tetrahydrofolate ligase